MQEQVDPGLVAGAIQALATVLAVIVGYGLSVLSDRNTRRTIARQALSERRLETAVALIDCLQTLREHAATVCQAFAPSFVVAAHDQGAVGQAKKTAALATAQRVSAAAVEAIVEQEQRCSRLRLTVKLMSFPEAIDIAAVTASALAKEAREETTRYQRGEAVSVEHLAGLCVGLDTAIDELLELGKSL